VKVMTLIAGSLTESVVAHGVTTAQHHVVYSAGMPGRIETMAFEPGDEVRRGAILARVDFKALKAQSRQAAGNAELASLTWERLSKLKAGDLITGQQYDEARSALISAQAQVDIAQSNLSGSIVKAEQNGIVTQKYADEGEYATPGMPLYEVVDYRQLIVEAQLAESQVAMVHRDAAVDVEIDALNETFRGAVEAVLPTADPVSRTFTARVRIDNPGLKILVGMAARLTFAVRTHERALIAPQSAVIEGQDGTRSVFVAVDGRAIRREVTPGAHQESDVILRSGVAEGDQLIVMGHRDLQDGQPIRILQ